MNAYAHIGRCKLFTGSAGETILLHEQAIRLSPRDPNLDLWCHRIGEAHLVQSRIDEAIRWLERGRSANQAFPAHHAWLAAACALKGDTERAFFEFTEARRLSGDDRYSSIARSQACGYFAVATIRTLFETTYFAGLRLAGMPKNDRRREPSLWGARTPGTGLPRKLERKSFSTSGPELLDRPSVVAAVVMSV